MKMNIFNLPHNVAESMDSEIYICFITFFNKILEKIHKITTIVCFGPSNYLSKINHMHQNNAISYSVGQVNYGKTFMFDYNS